MTDRPVTVIGSAAVQLHAGHVTRLRRPHGTLSTLKPGDRLWLRERFFLAKAFEHISPLQALERRAVPVFATDHPVLPDYAVADLGRCRFAREMPRAWHRAHLMITHVALERLHEISDAEIAAEGHSSRTTYAAAWNGMTSLKGKACAWENNPAVIAFRFTYVPRPLPEFVSDPSNARP